MCRSAKTDKMAQTDAILSAKDTYPLFLYENTGIYSHYVVLVSE